MNIFGFTEEEKMRADRGILFFLVLVFIATVSALETASAEQIYFEDFEGDAFEEWSVNTISGMNTWKIGGNDTAKSGSKSAYVSGNDNTAGYANDVLSESALKIPIDLTFYKNPVLTFWWKCMGEEGWDYGEVFVNDGADHRVSDEKEFANRDSWELKTINLTEYEGKSIIIRFRWYNDDSWGSSPGFCVDDVEIAGTYVSAPVFTSTPITKAITGTEYIYLITTSDYNGDDVTLTAQMLPGWLGFDPATGRLSGTPGETDGGIHSIEISASDGIHTSSHSFTISVPIFFEDFETEKEWDIDQEEGEVNKWAIGEAEAKNGNRSAYVSSDRGVSAGYDSSAGTDTNLLFPVDLTIYEAPVLSFWWKCGGVSDRDFGNVSVNDGIGDQLVSDWGEFVNNDVWKQKQISLSDFAGQEITLKFYWHNSIIGGQNPGFCVDDIEVTGSVVSNPIFTSTPTTKVQFEHEYRYNITTFDPQSGSVTISSSPPLPEWLELTDSNETKGTAVLVGTPGTAHFGSHEITLQATNGSYTVSQTFTIRVAAYYSGFERDNSEWSKTSDSEVNSWEFGNSLVKAGNSAAYISSDAGVSAGYDRALESNASLSVTLNLTFVDDPTLNFWWHCEPFNFYDGGSGTPIDYGEVYVNDGEEERLLSEPREYRWEDSWTEEILDLSEYSGEVITIRFFWHNSTGRDTYDSAFVLDDVMVTGTYTVLPIFTSEPKEMAPYNQEYFYYVTTDNSSSDTMIEAATLPDWLRLEDINVSQGTAVLRGTPGPDEVNSRFHDVILEATNAKGTTTHAFTVKVPYYYEDFEGETSEWQISSEPDSENFWYIGSAAVSNSGDFSAYVTNSKSDEWSFHHTGKKSESKLEFPTDLTYLESPSLSFYWKFNHIYHTSNEEDKDEYGEIYVRDVDGTTYLASEEREFVFKESWTKHSIDLSDYAGKNIFVQFYWYNSGSGAAEIEGLRLDDVEINGTLADEPIIQGPIFTSTYKDTDMTVHVGQTYTYEITTLDNTGDEVVISLVSGPDWLELRDADQVPGTAILSGTPSGQGYLGDHPVVIKASDGTYITQQSFDIYVFSQEEYRFERMWPELAQPWYFLSPEGIAMDERGYIYVLDTGNHRVLKFNESGQFITRWGHYGSGDGEFVSPGDIAVGPEGNVHVADTGNHRVQKFKPNGEFIIAYGSKGFFTDGVFRNPDGIDVDYRGNVYVADTDNSCIQKFTSKGEFLNRWGDIDARFTGEGKFHYLWDVAVDKDGNIYTVDSLIEASFEGSGHRVQKFDSDFNFIKQWGSYGSGNRQFKVPIGITVDENGDIYVADTYNSRIQKFSPDGDLLASWSTDGYGFSKSLHSNPHDIVVDPNGIIYVAEAGDNCVQKFSPEGEFLTKWGSFGSGPGEFAMPYGTVIDIETGNIHITDRDNHRIQVFDAESRFLRELGEYGSGEGEFKSPSGMVMDGQRRIYVADKENHRIQVFDTNGVLLDMWGSYGYEKGEFDKPVEVAVSKFGEVYVVDQGNNRIQRFNRKIGEVIEWGAQGDGIGQFRSPSELVIDKNNDIYVADTENHRVQKFDSEGNFVTQWGGIGSEAGKFSYPLGITADSDGDIFVADFGNNRIQKFSSEGQYLFELEYPGFEPGQINNPIWLATDSDDNLYVSEVINNRIQKFKKIESGYNNKAIIAAGGRENDKLQDEIQLNANTSYRAMARQGLSREDIRYLNSHSTLDYMDATKAALEEAITEWAADADNLFLYLVGHGGEGTFRVNDSEILDAAELNSWLDTLQESMPGRVVVVYDACRAGSFLSALTSADKDRIVITSTDTDESAYFTSQGFNAFSNYFWTHIYNGHDVAYAFEKARDSIGGDATDFQSPQIESNGNGIPNEPADLSSIEGEGAIHIGNGTSVYGDTPLTEVDDDLIILSDDTASASLHAYVTDNDGISRVWAEIRPPAEYAPTSYDKAVLELPTVELMSVGGGRYEGTFNGFTLNGLYQVVVYATDGKGNIAMPKVIEVSVGSPLRRKAVLVTGYAPSDEMRDAVFSNIELAHKALSLQGYKDDDIYLLRPGGFFLDGVIPFPADPQQLRLTLEERVPQQTYDVVLYLAGSSSQGRFRINETDILEPEDLNTWLDTLQNNIPGKVTVVFDALASGNYLVSLAPDSDKERIVITSTSPGQTSSFLFQSDVSFSSFFWRSVMNGENVKNAFWRARTAMEFLSQEQTPLLDDNGNGIGNEGSDGQTAGKHFIGMGIQLAADEPSIGKIMSDQTLHGETEAAIWVADVTAITDAPQTLWAVISPPYQSSDGKLPTKEMEPAGSGRYEGTYDGFSDFGHYHISVYASDSEGNTFHLRDILVYQAAGPDRYEPDNTHEEANVIFINDDPQHHNFFLEPEGDQGDWVKFHAIGNRPYKIEVSNLGENCSPIIELYGDTDFRTPIAANDPNAPETSMDWNCPESGIYYVKIRNIGVSGENTEYDLRVYDPTADREGTITGTVSDVSGEPVEDVKIETIEGGSALSSADGTYRMEMHPPGTFDLKASAEGYEEFKTESGRDCRSEYRNVSHQTQSARRH